MTPNPINYDVKECVEIVARAAPLLQRTPETAAILSLDAIGDKIFPVFNALTGLESAHYAVNIWRYCLHRGHYQEGIKALLKSQACSKLYPSALRITALIAIGVLYKRLGEYKLAMDYLVLAARLGEAVGHYKEQSYLFYQMGQIYGDLSHPESSELHLRACIEIAHKQNDVWMLASAYNTLGVIFLNSRRLEEADNYFCKSLSCWEELKDTERGLEAINNRAIVAGEMGNYALAESTYRKTLNLFRVLNDPFSFARQSQNLGDVCIYTRKYAEAYKHLHNAFQIYIKLGNDAHIYLSIISLSQVLYKEQDFPNALRLISYCEQARIDKGIETTPLQRYEADASLAIIRQKIKSNTFSRYWNQGKMLTLKNIESLFRIA